jgi:hypothetical protein
VGAGRLPADRRHGRAVVFALSAILALFAVGCPDPVCSFRGTINKPENLSMRRAMLRKAMGDICQQMTSRNAPLRLSPDSPVIGRFYPTQCSASEGDALNLTFSGYGYAWTNVTKKMTFTGGGGAAYRYDFQVTEGERCDVYAYFRPSRVSQSDLRVHRIEGTAAAMFNAMTQFGDNFGRQMLSKKLEEGFTVIAYGGKQNNVDFALGIVPFGKKPFHPYQVSGNDRATLENERVEVHQNQRDFAGPIVVEGKKRAIYLTARVDGAPAIDVMLMGKAEAEASLRLYFEYPQSGPLAAPPLTSDIVQAGLEWKRAIVVPPGIYYVVFDNTPSAGQVAPPVNAFDDRAAVVNYLIQIGDAS